MRAPAAAGSVLELGYAVHLLGGLGCFLLWIVFAFVFVVGQAAVSTLIPMAQMKPSSSRPTAVMIFL